MEWSGILMVVGAVMILVAEIMGGIELRKVRNRVSVAEEQLLGLRTRVADRSETWAATVHKVEKTQRELTLLTGRVQKLENPTPPPEPSIVTDIFEASIRVPGAHTLRIGPVAYRKALWEGSPRRDAGSTPMQIHGLRIEVVRGMVGFEVVGNG